MQCVEIEKRAFSHSSQWIRMTTQGRAYSQNRLCLNLNLGVRFFFSLLFFVFVWRIRANSYLFFEHVLYFTVAVVDGVLPSNFHKSRISSEEMFDHALSRTFLERGEDRIGGLIIFLPCSILVFWHRMTLLETWSPQPRRRSSETYLPHWWLGQHQIARFFGGTWLFYKFFMTISWSSMRLTRWVLSLIMFFVWVTVRDAFVAIISVKMLLMSLSWSWLKDVLSGNLVTCVATVSCLHFG